MAFKWVYSNTAEMAPATIHLKIAGEIANRLGINISGQFLLGAVAPDAVFARVGCSIDDIVNSHYRQTSVKNSWTLAVNEFKETENTFLLGYCIHIMTDVLWLSSVYADIKKLQGESFDKRILADDMNYLEKWLYRQNEYASLWNGVSGAKIQNINYYVSPGEIELFKSQRLQSIKYDSVNESMKYLTLESIDKFIKKSIKRILLSIEKPN